LTIRWFPVAVSTRSGHERATFSKDDATSLIVSEVYDALIEAGATVEKAKAAAAAIPVADRLVTREEFTDEKGMLKEDLTEVKSELKQDISGVRTELKQDIFP